MNGLDILLGAPLIFACYSGFKKGLIIELVSSFLLIFAVVKGVSLFYKLLPILTQQFSFLGDALSLCLAVCMLVIGGIAIYILTHVIKKVLNLTLFGLLDHFLGALFGLVKVAFLLSLVIDFSQHLSLDGLPAAGYTDDSLLYPILKPIAPKVLALIPHASLSFPFYTASGQRLQ